MPYKAFDRRRLLLRPLAERNHDLDVSVMLGLDQGDAFEDAALPVLGQAIRAAKENGRAVILLLGAHVFRSGVSAQLIDLMERGYVTHVGMNGGASIHDFELSLVGATTESVARYVRSGEFGLWDETGRLNDVAKTAMREGIGFGEALGRTIEEEGLPHKRHSLLAAAFRLGIPATVHVGIGHDIVHEHPSCDGAAWGAASYQDFLVLAESVRHLEGGVFLNIGTAIMGPEVYLKALAMARNVAHQEGAQISRFTTAVFDMQPLGGDTAAEPSKDDPRYYFRPWKTILVRTVADGGTSFYVEGRHRDTVPALRRHVLASEGGTR